jgi:hypothetical protein
MEYQTLPFPPPPFFLEKGCRNKLRKITRMRTTLERWGNHTMKSPESLTTKWDCASPTFTEEMKTLLLRAVISHQCFMLL